MKVIERVLLTLLVALTWHSVAASQSNDLLIPTDPHVNRINWAAAREGSVISGCPGNMTSDKLIDSLGDSSARYTTCSISGGEFILLDLGTARTVDHLQLHLYDGDDRFFRYRVEVSLDDVDYEVLIDRTSGEHRGIQRLDFESREVRYVKIQGTYSSSNNSFHLIDELQLLGDEACDPEEDVEITIDARTNSGSTYQNGVMLNLNAGIYKISHVSGATSLYTDDSANGGRTWDGRVIATMPLYNRAYDFGFTHDRIDRYATAALADAAMGGKSFTIQLPARADVYFWTPDGDPSNNRGSHTFLVQQLSGPNDSLLERVRDSMTRSVLWQQQSVASWSGASDWFNPDSSNPYCFGCHIQSQALEGLNASREKLPSLPVDENFLTVAGNIIFPKWQNPAGWVSPWNGGGHVVSQTSLWAWSLASYPGDTINPLIPNLFNALNWLEGVQQPNGGWNADHGGSSGPLYNDGAPSAAHTTGNIQALATALAHIEQNQFEQFANIEITGNSITFNQNYGASHDVLFEPVSEATGFRIIINDSFQSSHNFILSELELFLDDLPVTVSSAVANFEQSGYPISETIDGIKNDTNNGWGYYPRDPTVDPAVGVWVFDTPQDISRIRISQGYPDAQLRVYSISYTTDPNPTPDSTFLPLSVQQVGRYTFGSGSLGETFLGSLREAAALYVSAGWNFRRNTRSAAQTIIGLHSALPYLEPDAAVAASTRMAEVAAYLRSIQREDGGWYDTSGVSRVFPSAQALRALLLLSPSDLDEVLRKGAEYLLRTQEADGSWRSPPIGTKLAITTWVEIALPTLFDVLSQDYLQDIVTDVTAYGAPDKVDVFWTPLAQAVSYNIYRRTEGTSWVQIATDHVSDVATFTDTNVVNEATYYYKVRWNDGEGVESADSNEASATPYGMQCDGDTPPVITSPPVLGAVPDVEYRYQVEASDADPDDTLTYSLPTAPAGMAIDPSGGAITWVPSSAQNGPHPVTIKVTDSIGRFAVQGYRVVVAPIYVNYPPQFSTSPVLDSIAGQLYLYNSHAIDPNSTDILTYELVSGPAGMTINSSTGRVRWTPPGDTVPGTTFPVHLRVADVGGLTHEQEYILTVAGNTPPTITSTPRLITPRLVVYSYDVEATDAEGGRLTYTLVESPAGMSISRASGLILWSPTLEQVGTHPVRVKVTDEGGLFALQEYELRVPENDPPHFTSSPVTFAVPNTAYGYNADAVDPENQPLRFSLELGPTGMNIDESSGEISWLPTEEGREPVSIKVTDDIGLTAQQSFVIDVSLHGGNGGGGGGSSGDIPGGDAIIEVHAPAEGSTISNPSVVFATINTTLGPPDSWSAALTRDGDSVEIPFASGTGAVENQEIGTLDPTLLSNDLYYLAITVVKGGGWERRTFPYLIDSGNLKLGVFELTLSDVAIPLSGLPLEIRRRYSTLDRGMYEFGAGWRLAVPGRVVDSTPEVPDGIPMGGGARVFVTRPDGRRVGFTFAPYKLSPILPFWIPAFTPDPGVTDVLEVDETVLFNSGGEFWELFNAYNPSRYYLTTREKVRYTLIEGEGLVEARDANFNTITFTDGAIIHSSGAQISIERDGENRITQITDLNGGTVHYTYDGAGDLVTVENQVGETTTFTYQAPHLLKKIILDSGTTVLENLYAADGRLIGQIDGEGHQTSIGVDVANGTEVVTDRRGGVTTYRYDEEGNLLSRTDPLGRTRAYTYDERFNVTSETDELGRTSTFTYDDHSNVLAHTDKLGQTTSYTYSDLDQVTSITAPGGAVRTLSYDGRGNITSLTDFTGRTKHFDYDINGNLLSLTNGVGSTSFFTYDSEGRPISGTDALGNSVHLAYDDNGNLIERTRTRTDNDGNVHVVTDTYLYDDANRVIQSTDGEGRSVYVEWNEWNKPTLFRDKRGIETTFEYDGNGLLLRINRPDGTTNLLTYDEEFNKTSETDRRGFTTTYAYDPLDRMLSATYPDGGTRTYSYDGVGNIATETDQLGRTTVHLYDELNRRISTTDPLGGITQFAYDEFNNLTEQVDPLGRRTLYDIDPAGRVLQMVYPDLTTNSWSYDGEGRETSFTDARGNTSQMVYDAVGRVIQSIDELGAVTESVYDEVGNRIREIDPLGNTTRYDYNNAGELIRRLSPLGATESYLYDGNGNTISHTDENGRTTTTVYDVNDRVTSTTLADGATTSYTYDGEGNRLTLTDPVGNTTTFTYDARRREISRTDPLGHLSQRTYDLVGNIIEEVDRLGRRKSYTYDALNQRTSEVWSENGGVVRTKSFSYDGVGNLLQEGDEASRYTYTYDNRDRVTSIDTFGTPNLTRLILSKSYDAEGNVTQVVDNLGLSLEALFDARGYLQMKRWQGGGTAPLRTEWSYDPRGELAGVSRYDAPSGGAVVGATTVTVDGDGRETGRVHRDGDGDTVAEYACTYNPGGEVLSVSDHGQSSAYTYDQQGQLLTADHSDIPDESFSYDANGNRVGGAYVVGPNNQVLSDGEYDYTYDEEGSLIRRTNTGTGEYTEFGYDLDNHIVSAVRYTSGGTVLSSAEYIYDVRGRRIGKIVNGVAQYTHYLGDDSWADFNGAQQLTARYLHGQRIDEIVARYRVGEGTELYLTDRLGSVQDRMNLTGGVTNSLRYRTYGGIGTESGVGDRFKFTGREFDAETGLYYYRARYFDPRLGRFLSEDPLGFRAGDTNLSRYVGNSPGNGVDPSGMAEAAGYASALQVGRMVAGAANALAVAKKIHTAVKIASAVALTVAVAERLARQDNVLRAYSVATDYGLDIGKQIGNSFMLATVLLDLMTGTDVTTHITPDGQITQQAIIEAAGYTAVAAMTIPYLENRGGAGADLPALGRPGSVAEGRNSRGDRTVREYGPGGRAETDYDFGHDHNGAGDPHAHDWNWSNPGPGGARQPARPLRPGETVPKVTG